MKAFLLTFLGLTLIFVGCGSHADSRDIPAAAEAMARAQNQYGGEWSRLPDKDKQLILQQFGGDEAAAERGVRIASMAPKAPVAGQVPSQFLPQ